MEWLRAPVSAWRRSRRSATGDILFIDSSHQVKPGSDVEFLLKAVLPLLPAGVRVHFHDIFIPDDYPPAWEWRRYNEQAAVAALIESDIFKVDFASHALVSRPRRRSAACWRGCRSSPVRSSRACG